MAQQQRKQCVLCDKMIECPIKEGPMLWEPKHDDPTFFTGICWSGLAEAIIEGRISVVGNEHAKAWSHQYINSVTDSSSDEDNIRHCQFCSKELEVEQGEVVVLTDESVSCKICYEDVSDKYRGHECVENEKSLGYFEAESAEDYL